MNAARDRAEEAASASQREENPYQAPATNDLPTAEPFPLPLGVLAMLVVIGLFVIAAILGIVAHLSIAV